LLGAAGLAHRAASLSPSRDRAQVELLAVLLILEIAINRHEDIKLLLSQAKQGAVAGTAPASLSNRFDCVAGERV